MTINILSRNKKQYGFTLIELLIAVSLLAIGLLATATMQGIALNANSFANRLSVANKLGQQVADELASLSLSNTASYSLLTTAVDHVTYNRMYDPVAGTSTASSVSISGAGTFSATYSISPNTPIAGTTQIDVFVTYIGMNRSPQVAQYTTYKTVT